MKVAVNSEKQQRKAYTHRKAKVTILSAQNNNPRSASKSINISTRADHMSVDITGACALQHLVVGVFGTLWCGFGSLLEAFVLRTDAAFVAPGLPNLCWCRNGGFRTSKRRVGAAFCARGVFRTLKDISVAY